jgi:hypothetical protein
MIELAFTTRIPLALMIFLGIKQWENRAAMPVPARGRCAMTCSKTSDAREYQMFRMWAESVFPREICASIPPWEDISSLRGKLVAVCDYEAGYTPGPKVWDEGYPVWWRLTNVRLLDEPIPCRGSVGMWRLPMDIMEKISP